MSPDTKALVEGGIADRTTQCLKNLSAVLEEAGSSLQNCVKVNVFLTDMTNFAAMNKVYDSFFDEPKPVRSAPFPLPSVGNGAPRTESGYRAEHALLCINCQCGRTLKWSVLHICR